MAAEVFTPDVVEPTPTPTPEVAEAPTPETQQTPETPDVQNAPKTLQMEDVNEFIMSPEAKNSLSQIGLMETMLKEGTLPPNVKTEYENLKKKMQTELTEDPYFQQAMEQLGVSLDENIPIEEIKEPDAGDFALNIIGNPLTWKQMKGVTDVLNKSDELSTFQKVALNKGLSQFTDDISSVFKKIINPENNQEKAA